MIEIKPKGSNTVTSLVVEMINLTGEATPLIGVGYGLGTHEAIAHSVASAFMRVPLIDLQDSLEFYRTSSRAISEKITFFFFK